MVLFAEIKKPSVDSERLEIRESENDGEDNLLVMTGWNGNTCIRRKANLGKEKGLLFI